MGDTKLSRFTISGISQTRTRIQRRRQQFYSRFYVERHKKQSKQTPRRRVFANIFAQDTLSFKKTRDKNIYIEFLGASNLIGVSFDSRFTPISPWGYRIGISYFQGGDSFIKASNSNRGLFFPIEVNFLTSGNKHKLELGLGSNLGIYNEHISFIEKSKDQYETINLTSNTTFGYYFFSNIGYRYISTKGFLFRIGLSPSFSFNDKHGVTKEPFIYPYISFGYSF